MGSSKCVYECKCAAYKYTTHVAPYRGNGFVTESCNQGQEMVSRRVR